MKLRAPPALLALLLSAACSDAPPSWDSLITAKVAEQYPQYLLSNPEPGKLRVQAPGRPAQTMDLSWIAQYCQRGPRDCNYAMDQLLIALRPSAP